MTSSPAGRLGPRCSMNFSPTPNNSGALSLPAMTNWRAGRDNRENLDRNRRVKLTKILGALLLWSAPLFNQSFVGSRLAGGARELQCHRRGVHAALGGS